MKPRDSGIGGQRHSTSPATCASIGQPLTPMVSAKLAQSSTSSPVSWYGAGDAARLADAELRRDVDDVGVREARRLALQELEELADLAAALDLAGGQLVGVGAVERAAVRLLQLRDVDAPFDRILLRPHDRALARKFARRAASASSISAGIVRPGLARARPDRRRSTRNIMVG